MNGKVKQLLSKGEGLNIEFKKCKDKISETVYETVCSFLNTKGGNILLGVEDSGKVIGIDKNNILKIQQDFINSVNNPSKIFPPFCLSVNEIIVNNKSLLHIFVPESSQVHRCNTRIFIRNASGDFDITDKQQETANLYIRKQSSYSENKIFPAVNLEDLRVDLVSKARKLAGIQDSNHPWLKITDMELFKTSALYQKDPMSGEEGFTLAAILLLGKDETIASVAPAFRIDLIKKVDNIDRYDDRVDLRTNLIDAYDYAMDFIKKHLPDPFFMKGGQRISLRENIFREVIANIIVHKEYLGGEPTRLIIEKDRIFTENSNRPYINGIINLSNLVSHPKNPNIAKFFRQIGRVEELGSGVRRLYSFCKAFGCSNPEIRDENIFKFILPINFYTDGSAAHDTAHDTAHDNLIKDVSDRTRLILSFCISAKSRDEIQKYIGLKHRQYFITNILNPLVEDGKLLLTIPNKPRSKNQKYITKCKKGSKYFFQVTTGGVSNI